MASIYRLNDTAYAPPEGITELIDITNELMPEGIKAALSAIKAILGLNIAAAVLNAIIAGIFVATIGETSKYLFEQVYLGDR